MQRKISIPEKEIIREIDKLKEITLDAIPEIRSYILSKVKEIELDTCMGIVIHKLC